MSVKHLASLLRIRPYAARTELIARYRPSGPVGLADNTSPIKTPLRGDSDAGGELLMEFNSRGEMVFAEAIIRCNDEKKALLSFHRLEPELLRGDLIMRDSPRKPPVRRSGLSFQHMLAWNRWQLDEQRCLQVIIGSFSQRSAKSAQIRLAASVHIDADMPGYGPKPGDVSTGQALGWDDFYGVAPPDLHGRVSLIRDAQSTITPGEPGRYGPGSVFRVFM